jgi:hypothetical protein
MPSGCSIFSAIKGFDVSKLAYDIDPNAARVFQGTVPVLAFRRPQSGFEEPKPSPRALVLAYQLLNFSDLSWP